jgi:hypothetical protein
MRWLAIVSLAACGGGAPDPHVITGGGISDGPIDGTLYVFAISDDDVPIAGATVEVAGEQKTTDDKGFAEFSASGAQTIAVHAEGFRNELWVGANGANVTIPLEPTTPPRVPQATLQGSITGWDTITVPAQHIKAAIVMASQTDDLGDPGNSLTTPNLGNICGIGASTCDWTLVARAGTLTLYAAIVDRDTKGTADQTDDTTTIIGYAVRTGVAVSDGVGMNGLALAPVEAGNLENVTVDLGTPPAALTTTASLVGIDVDEDDVVQLPGFLATSQTSLLAPKPSVFGAAASYRLTAIAQTASGDAGAQSILLLRGLTSTTLAAGTWLVPPTGVSATRTSATWQPVAEATIHTLSFVDAGGIERLNVGVFDDTTSIDIPQLVALPISGQITMKAAGIGAELDVQDFSLEEDDDLLWGIAAEPVTIP